MGKINSREKGARFERELARTRGVAEPHSIAEIRVMPPML